MPIAREVYAAQVALLVCLVPFIAQEEVFALKGGTAINLFYRDMPRVSVDIDLTYLQIRERAESLADIDETLNRIVAAATRGIPGLDARRIDGGSGGAPPIRARLDGAEVKIEPRPSRVASSTIPTSAGYHRPSKTSSASLRFRSCHSRICLEASSTRRSIANIRATCSM